MNTLYPVWNLFLLFSLLIVPQLLGVLVYFRLRPYEKALAHFAGFLIPPVLFFYFALVQLVNLPQKAHPNDRCGMAAVAVLFIVLVGTGLQTGVSLLIQLGLGARHPKTAA